MKSKYKAKLVVITACPDCNGKRLVIRSEITGTKGDGLPKIYCCDCRKYIGILAGKVLITGV